jgi:hypothetical protein
MFSNTFLNDTPPPPDHSPPPGMYSNSPPPPSPRRTPTRVFYNPPPKRNRQFPIWADHAPTRQIETYAPARPKKPLSLNRFGPSDKIGWSKNRTHSHLTYHNDSSVCRVFDNKAFLSPGVSPSSMPFNGRFTFTTDGKLRSDTSHCTRPPLLEGQQRFCDGAGNIKTNVIQKPVSKEPRGGLQN